MGDYDWHIETDENSWSDQLYRIYGYEPQEFNASYDGSCPWCTRTTATRDGHPPPGVRGRRRVDDGRADRAARWRRAPSRHQRRVVKDEDGTPVRMRGTCIDITERVRAEAASEELAASLREWQVRRRHAFEINDNVVQGISAAALSLELGDLERLRRTSTARFERPAG